MANGTSGTKSGSAQANPKPQAQKAAQAAPVQATPPVQPAPVAQAPVQPAPPTNPGTFSTMTDADAAAMVAKYDTYNDPDVVAARKLYISDSNPNKDGFSHAQNLNYKLDNGYSLNANEQFIDDNLQYGMHALGKNTKLVRYCHDDILQQLGVKDYSKMSEAQLKKQLVGRTFQLKSYMSTSYDAKKSPFAPGAAQGGGREIKMGINAMASTMGILGAKKQTEVILNKGTNAVVKNVYFDGTTATPRNKGSRPRLAFEIETY